MAVAIKNKKNGKVVSQEVLQSILAELRLLRNEVMLLLPRDELGDYSHPERIKKAYQNALKKYPPATVV